MANNRAAILGPLMLGTVIYIIIGFIGEGGSVQATHFRGGTISWKPSDSFSLNYREVIFTFKLGWRLSRIGCDNEVISTGTLVGEDARWFCMFGCEGVISTTREKCTEFNLGEDWMQGSNSFTHVFDSDGPIEISYSECCWLTDLVVGAGGEWALTTTLNLGIRSDTSGPNSSPVTAMAPMITLRAGVADVIDLAVRDSDGDKVACRLGRHVGECGTICSLFSEFSLDEENCLIRYNPVSNTTGKIPVAVMVEDFHQSNEGITMGRKTFSMSEPLSSVPVQFLVILEHPLGNCTDKPTISLSIPPEIPVKVRPGRPFKFTVTSAPCDVTTSIDEFILIAPLGVRRSPIIIADGMYTTEITWTPEPDQDGTNLVCVTARSSNGVLSEKLCVTVEVPKATATCTVIDGSQFITFDQSRFDYTGMCRYQLVRTLASTAEELTPFNISLTNEQLYHVSNEVRLGTITVEVLDHVIHIDRNRNVELDGLAVHLPIRLKSGMRVEKSGRGVAMTLSLALRVHIDENTLIVQMSRSYLGHVEGLCGNYNGDSTDDMSVRGNDVIASNVEDFAANYQIGHECNNPPRDDGVKKRQCILTEELEEKCLIIHEEDGCFSACHDFINPMNYYNNCISALCTAVDEFSTLDVQVRAYADACQRASAKVCDWRKKLGISLECEPYSHYESCARTVPPTCADTDSNTNSNPTDSCIEGCVCDKGYILSGSACVPESECGCTINGNYYPKGFTYRTEDCRQVCVCGKECTPADPCNKQSKCQRGTDGFHRCIVIPRKRATCKAVTDPHYETFDGTKFDSMGNCAYIMVRSKRNSTLTSFTVIAVNEKPNFNKSAAHVKEVHINFGDGHVLSFLRGPKVILDDKEVNPGSNVYGVDIRLVGKMVAADFNFGLVVRWDGVDRLRITAWSPLRYMVEGLCGDFDDNPDNDFAVRPTEENLPDPGSFAQSWRIEGYGTEGCKDHPGIEIPQPPCGSDEELAKYKRECRGLVDPKGSFAKCHDLVSPLSAFDNCVFDLCAYEGDRTVKERIFSSYTEDCLEASSVPIVWRPEEDMPLDCKNGNASSCMEQCQPTCSDPDASVCLSKNPQQLGSTCVEGCVCAPGYLLSGNECVLPEDCGCFVNGRYEKKGFSFAIANCSDTCECKGPENLECSPTPFGCKKNRDRCERRDDGYFQCTQRLRRRATCKAVTDPHYMTFDGKKFDSMGTCAYIMVRSKASSTLKPFIVVAVNEQPDVDRIVSHVKEAWVTVGDDLTLSFTNGGVVRINDKIVEAGTNMSGIEIRSVGRFIVAAFDFGLVLRWDGKDRLRVSAWGKLRGHLEGICGDFDDDESNDFMTPEGVIVSNITDFVNSWQIDGYDSEGCRDALHDPPTIQCDDKLREEYEKVCSIILNENGSFAECHSKVDPISRHQDCVFDLCVFNGNKSYMERIFSEYEQECKEASVLIPGEWRDSELTFNCTPNSHHNSDMEQCQPSCTDKDASICRTSGTLGAERISGCACDEGYIMSGTECILEEQCGCVKDDGAYLKLGFTYRTRDCSLECECTTGGVIVCNPAQNCSRGDRCRHDTDGYKRCIPHVRRRATCKAVTDPHYQTFDGINYDSMGTCAYVMARSKEGADVTSFSVVAVNEQPQAHQNVSHVKELYVHVGDDVTLSMKAGHVVSINGEIVLPGTTLFGIKVRKVGRFTVAEFPFGLVVRWDGIDRLRVMAWAELKGKMEGLCGDFNDNRENDFMTPSGVIESDLTTFVNSWRVEGYNTEGCEDTPVDPVSPCENNDKLEEFRESCRILIDPEGVMRPCHEVRDPNSAYNNCVFDLCAYDGDEEIRQRSISSFVEDCLEDVPNAPDDLTWIPVENSTVDCSGHSSLVSSIEQCQPTCSDPDASICKADSTLGTHRVEGCKCNDGYILSGEKCVALRQCGCEIEGRYVIKGFKYLNKNCSVEYTCLGQGQVSSSVTGGCGTGMRCRFNGEGKRACIQHVRRRATCSAVTDPHYMTFDKKRYDSMGTCAYIMVRSREGADVEKFRVIAVNERPNPKQIVSHVKEVHVEVGKDFHLSFSAGPVVKINGEIVLPGSRINNVEIRKVGKFTVAEFEFGLVIRWDGIDRLRIGAWSELKGKMEGLCGDFDDDPTNDFRTPRGEIEENVNRFVRSWKVHQYSPQECFESPTINETGCPNEEILKQYKEECSVLTDPVGQFAKCHENEDPNIYYENCLFDMCWSNGDQEMKDRNINEYTETCLSDPKNTPENITERCAENTVSRVPMSQCQPTCSDPDGSICEATSKLGNDSTTGCVCVEGMILSGDTCVLSKDCGCRIDGKYVEKGYRFLNYECDVLCICVGLGDVQCLPTDPCERTERCGKNDNQQYQCLPFSRKSATCKAITDPHFTTYDGKTFDSLATCAYVMTRSVPDSDVPSFSVVAVHEPSDSGRTSSSVKEVHVQVGENFNLTMVRNTPVRINDKAYNHGSTVKGVSIRKIGLFTVVDFPFGLVVRWDGEDRLRITVWEQLREKVEGICGNFNEDKDDDFTTKEGVLTTNATAFVESWKVTGHNSWKCKDNQQVTEDQCSDLSVLANYREECSVLVDLDGPFKSCERVVDPKLAYDACVSDLCRMRGDNGYKDRVISSFVHDCMELSETPEPWRFGQNLPMKCTANSKYSRCMHQCQPTCGDLDASICKSTNPFLLGSYCVEGCKCNSGFYLSDKKCVPTEKCGCQVKGVYYTKGFKYKTADCKQECECVGNNIFECRDFRGCLDTERCSRAFGGYFQCRQKKRRRATCKAITDPHYTTFDRKRFDSQGVCSYTMVRSKSTATVEPFTIVAVNEQPMPKIRVSHVKEVHLEFKGNYRLSFYAGPMVKLNDEVVLPGTTTHGIEIRKVGRFLTAVSDFGITIRWDGEDRLRIIAWGSLRGQIEGLCGDFNDDPSDDFVHALTGEVLTEPEDFVNSWRAMGYNDECRDVAADALTEFPPAFECDPESREHFAKSCYFVMDPNGPLKNCLHLVDAEAVYHDCTMDNCAYGGDENVKERVVSDFADFCREEGGTLEENWREVSNLTTPKCKKNSHFVISMHQCQPTCHDLDGSECRRKLELEDGDVEGCQADDGYVLSGDSYVHSSECGCKKDGRYYMNEDAFYTPGCATLCQCKGGTVTCNVTKCARDEECVINNTGKLDCILIETSTCQAWGSSHILSFDGNQYDLSTECNYIFAKREIERGDPRSRLESFTISASPVQSPDNSHLTVMKNIRIRLPEQGISALLRPEAEARVMGKNVYNWKHGEKLGRLVTVDKRGSFTVLKTFFGLEVAYDGTNLRVTLPKRIAGKTSGLCGDLNGDPTDDFRLKDGTLTDNKNKFASQQLASSCKSQKARFEPICSKKDRRKWSASNKCGAIIDMEGDFAHCSSKLDAGRFFEQCVHDLCISNNSNAVLAEALKTYAHECLSVNAPVCDWRKTYLLQIACPVNSHYIGCTEACEETCGTHDVADCRHQQVEDCVCDTGYIRSKGACIPEANCGGCIIEAQMMPKDFTYRRYDCSETCTCVGNGKVVCKVSDPCITRANCGLDDNSFEQCLIQPREKATCQVFGSAHFATFDGAQFDSSATCAYTMVRTVADASVPTFSVKVDMQPSTTNPNLSRVAQVIVTAKDLDLIMAQGQLVKVNGRQVALGSVLDVVTIRKIGIDVVAIFNFGLVLRWDGKQNLRIEAWTDLRNQVEGLCGDFDENEKNDFRTISGVVETDISAFVDSWRDGKSANGCRLRKETNMPCQNPDEFSRYQTYCNDTFNSFDAVCKLRDHCLVEMCVSGGNKEVVDKILFSFAKECTDEYSEIVDPAFPIPLPDIICPLNGHFEACFDQCQPTCSDPDSSICEATAFLSDNCVRGCQCNEGYMLDRDECVQQSECGCVGDGGEYYQNNFNSHLEDCESKCQCKDGTLTCQNTECLVGKYCGYRKEDYGCHWEDECKYGNGGCSQLCSWEDRKIVCTCRPGYHLATDNSSCINEDPKTGLNISRWKQDTMQTWIKKLDAYLDAAKQGAEKGEPAYACNRVWSPWYDRDDPKDAGDDESFESLKREHPDDICDHPVAIEAELIDGRNILATGNVINTLSARKGLVCLNSEQRDGEKCGDFKVRFLCLEELI